MPKQRDKIKEENINNIKIEDYKKQIVDYRNGQYSSWQYSDGTKEGPIGIEDVEKEI